MQGKSLLAGAVCCATLLISSFHSAHADLEAHTGRDLLATTAVTVTASIQPFCQNRDSWVLLTSKNSAGYRGECGTASGDTVPCLATSSDGGALNYSVNQGDTLTVSFRGAATTYVFTGGSLNDGFLASDGCFLTTTTTSAPSAAQAVISVADTGFVFKPTGAVCSQFYNNTIGTLSVLAFDTASTMNSGGYYAACKFEIGVIIVPNPQSALSANQLFPDSDGAAALAGSMFKVLGLAVLGAVAILVLLQ